MLENVLAVNCRVLLWREPKIEHHCLTGKCPQIRIYRPKPEEGCLLYIIRVSTYLPACHSNDDRRELCLFLKVIFQLIAPPVEQPDEIISEAIEYFFCAISGGRFCKISPKSHSKLLFPPAVEIRIPFEHAVQPSSGFKQRLEKRFLAFVIVAIGMGKICVAFADFYIYPRIVNVEKLSTKLPFFDYIPHIVTVPELHLQKTNQRFEEVIELTLAEENQEAPFKQFIEKVNAVMSHDILVKLVALN